MALVVGFCIARGYERHAGGGLFDAFLLDTDGQRVSSRQHEHGDSSRLFRDERHRQ